MFCVGMRWEWERVRLLRALKGLWAEAEPYFRNPSLYRPSLRVPFVSHYPSRHWIASPKLLQGHCFPEQAAPLPSLLKLVLEAVATRLLAHQPRHRDQQWPDSLGT